MNSFDFPQKCTQCGNLKTFPYSWSITSPPMMCNCTNNNPLGKKPKHWKKFDPKNYPVVSPFVTDDLKLKKLLFKDDM
jgi:hypothetical protein